MSAQEVPPVLDQIAAAGGAGLDLKSNPSALGEIETCRAWGFPVRIREDRALLPPDPDLLIPAWIENETAQIAWGKTRVRGFLEIGSTNDEALSLARAGAPEGLVLCAERQTAGKGRLGRKWISPTRSGLYFSLVLRPQQPPDRWPMLTHVAAISLFRSLRDLNDQAIIPHPLDVDLKWPNDVLLSGKKAAGILLETACRGSVAEAAIAGIGVNVAADAVPSELRSRATSVSEEAGFRVPRRWILVRFLNHFQAVYRLFNGGDHAAIIEQWKSCSTMWNGVEVAVTEGEHCRIAVTCGLTEWGALRIRAEGGREEIIHAGDVSVRRR